MTPAKEKKPWQPPGLSCCLRSVAAREALSMLGLACLAASQFGDRE